MTTRAEVAAQLRTTPPDVTVDDVFVVRLAGLARASAPHAATAGRTLRVAAAAIGVVLGTAGVGLAVTQLDQQPAPPAAPVDHRDDDTDDSGTTRDTDRTGSTRHREHEDVHTPRDRGDEAGRGSAVDPGDDEAVTPAVEEPDGGDQGDDQGGDHQGEDDSPAAGDGDDQGHDQVDDDQSDDDQSDDQSDDESDVEDEREQGGDPGDETGDQSGDDGQE